MARTLGNITRFVGGIANSPKEGQQSSFAWGRSIEHRADSRQITVLPQTVKESGSIVTDLVMWADRIPATGDLYLYGNTGNLYRRTSATVWSLEHTAPMSTGNGLAYFGEDDYLYYPQNTTIGRYGPTPGTSSANWHDGFLESEGGAPTNTNSLSLVAASSQYADRADTASLSITGSLTLESYVKFTTLPTTSNTMTLVAKWDESGTTRSYIMDVKGVSGSFGDGSDGALTIASDTTEAPIDSACSGTSGTYALTATNASFAANQKILIHQTQGTGAGTQQTTTIASYTAGTITTADVLNFSYATGAQVRVLKQYSSVTINGGITYSAKAWNGSVGGILAFLCSGTLTVTGSITAKGKGLRGGNGASSFNTVGTQGEGLSGVGGVSTGANGAGGGAGLGTANEAGGGGGGGGHASVGTDGHFGEHPQDTGGTGGSSITDTADLTTASFGGGGGGGGVGDGLAIAGNGGAGGGYLLLAANTITITGIISSDGANGVNTNADQGGGGGGGGGAVLLKTQVATLGTNLITAIGGTGGTDGRGLGDGGAGSTGRIHISYYTSYTGTTNPTLDAIQDDGLAANTGWQMRLGVSSTGTNSEYLTKIFNPVIGTWTRLSITWLAASSLATFYQDGVSLGTATGTLTAIHDNASRFGIGANNGGSGITHYLNGLVDDVRVWNFNLSGSQIVQYLNSVLTGTESFLQGYWKFDNTANDTTANANNLTLQNAPTYSTDVPFSGVTTRGDQDQQHTDTGFDYDLLTSISEAAVDLRSFVPAKDPQKSIRFNIVAIGTGNWTVTIHDALNRQVATVTKVNNTLNTGFFEFMYAAVFRPVIGATYHAHVISTVADGTVRTSVDDDLSAADYATFFQILVSDIYHPTTQFLNFLAIGNERYLATYDGLTYSPMRLTLPPGYRIRCLGFWREYLAIGTWRGTNITDYDSAKVFFWDGTSTTYNFYITVPEGQINAIYGNKGTLYIWAGYTGNILTYQYQYGTESAQKLRRIPKATDDTTIEIYPGGVNTWKAFTLFAIGTSTSTTVERGVYSWGSLDQQYPPSLGFDYPISTDNRTTTTVKIGCIYPAGQNLFIGWQDNVSFGVDVVSPSGSPFATATLEGLISDFGKISQQKLPLVLKADFVPLRTGETITLKYKADRASNWNSTGQVTVSTVGATEARLIVRQRVREFQPAIDFTATTTSPTLLGLSLETDVLEGEKSI